MCGIFGGIIEKEQLDYITGVFISELKSRGPDAQSFYYDQENGVVLGHTRLSIIDLTQEANQPMKSDDGRFLIVFNGEIYNFLELKKELINIGLKFFTNSDTEVLLKGFILEGINFVKRCRGMFSFCVYDRLKGLLHLVRDRFGIKPLIYTIRKEGIFFSSELTPFIKAGIFDKTISLIGLNYLIKYGAVKQPYTILDNFFQLLPGHYLVYDIKSKSYTLSKYYDITEEFSNSQKPKDYDEAVEYLKEELIRTTKYHMVSDVEVGAFLSGGVDSTSVVALMRMLSNQKIKTFTVGFAHKTYVVDETKLAEDIAKHLDCDHTNVIIDEYYLKSIIDEFIMSIDQPSIDGINTFIVSRETSKKVKVALSGLGGDEIFVGYPHFKYIYESRSFNTRFSGFIHKLYKIRPNRFIRRYAIATLDEQTAVEEFRTINRNVRKILNEEFVCLHLNDKESINHSIREKLSTIQKISLHEINNYLRNTLLRDTDAVSMSNSLEVRPILLDHKLVEFVFSLPDHYKIRKGLQKAILIDSVKSLIPETVWKRKKTGFDMPYKDWLNNIFHSEFCDLLNSSNAKVLLKSSFMKDVKLKAKLRGFTSQHWLFFIILSWMDKYNISL